jgi:hypothetical protein
VVPEGSKICFAFRSSLDFGGSMILALVGIKSSYIRHQWRCGIRCGPAAARLLGLRLRIPPEAWMSVSCKCCVLPGTGLCLALITRPEESHRVWCV